MTDRAIPTDAAVPARSVEDPTGPSGNSSWWVPGGALFLARASDALLRFGVFFATAKILDENGIRYPYSADLRTVWETPSQPGVAAKSAQANCCGPATTN